MGYIWCLEWTVHMRDSVYILQFAYRLLRGTVGAGEYGATTDFGHVQI